MSRFMTEAEVASLTGYKQAARQIEWLKKNGIPYTLNGFGLPKLSLSEYESAVEAAGTPQARPVPPVWVYFISMDSPTGEPLSKIGITQHTKARFDSLKGANPYPIRLVTAFKFKDVADAKMTEQQVLSALQSHRVRNTEWVTLPVEKLVETFHEVTKQTAVFPAGDPL